MNAIRGAAVALLTLGPLLATGTRAASPAASTGYVDGAMFRALVDEDREIVEVNLDGPMLRAIAKSKGDDPEDHEADELFGKLKAIHAVIGTVKGSASAAMSLVTEMDKKLAASGWQRITRIRDESSVISVLTHTTADHIDGLVALIFDMDDKELVFANLAGEIDITRLGEIGERLDVPGLDRVPGAR